MFPAEIVTKFLSFALEMDGYKLKQMQREAVGSTTSELFCEKEIKAWGYFSGLQKLEIDR